MGYTKCCCFFVCSFFSASLRFPGRILVYGCSRSRQGLFSRVGDLLSDASKERRLLTPVGVLLVTEGGWWLFLLTYSGAPLGFMYGLCAFSFRLRLRPESDDLLIHFYCYP